MMNQGDFNRQLLIALRDSEVSLILVETTIDRMEARQSERRQSEYWKRLTGFIVVFLSAQLPRLIEWVLTHYFRG